MGVFFFHLSNTFLIYCRAQESSLAAEEAVLNQFINDIKVKKRKAPAYDVNVPGLSRIELDEQQDIYNIQLAHVR